MEEDLVRLSKTISYALRHNPGGYGLQLDNEGRVPVEELLNALRQRHEAWQWVSAADLDRMAAASEKQRFELHAGTIRAFYGHCIVERVEKQPAIPPALPYRGTTPQAASAIQQEGLRPMKRQYVHLSTSEQTARAVALRRTARPVIVHISALAAHHQGIRFYPGNQDIWLADAIPPPFLHIQKE
ncbi:MAG TPA: RNA 2'-phosphotransferase [Ktedonobacteraceae bacterium]|jgi:putative RNA 2'-phosphotransferase